MLKNITRALPLSLLVAVPVYANDAPNQSLLQTTTELLEYYGPGFESLEHKYMGDLVQLHLPEANSTNAGLKLNLPNGLKLSYGEMIMYAADMFGNPEKPVSDCEENDRLSCFKSQFEAIATQGRPSDKRCSNPINQARNLIQYIEVISKELEKSRQAGVDDGDYYYKRNINISKQLNKLTCGGSIISAFIPYGTYLRLAQVNYDHFVPDSLIAYKAGHRYALETALKGFTRQREGNIDEANKLLELAYAQNAFANHYLTDSFSAGHMRTPRRAIAENIFLPAVLKLLIANLMHDEDNKHGLNVVNAEGTSWVAYGDGYLFIPETQLHRIVMLNAMQRSADGIFYTFKTGKIPNTFPELSLLPDYRTIEQLNQTAPLFKVEDGVLLKRVKNKDYYDYHWTKYWSGLITLIEFKVGN